MKKALIAVCVAGLLSTNAQADAIGLYIGGQIWDREASGEIGEQGNLVDFNLKDEQQGSYYVAFEHPIPFFPNAKISQTTLDTQGSTELNDILEFGDTTFDAGTNVNASVDISYVDYTLYYELFDNDLLTFDFGITARDFSGDINVSSTVTTTDNAGNQTSTQLSGDLSFSSYVPMLYASTIVGLPFTGLNLFAEGNFLSFDDHMLYDYQAGISYELVDNLAVDVNLTLGYREVKLELEDLDDLYSDVEFSGVFAGVVVHF